MQFQTTTEDDLGMKSAQNLTHCARVHILGCCAKPGGSAVPTLPRQPPGKGGDLGWAGVLVALSSATRAGTAPGEGKVRHISRVGGKVRVIRQIQRQAMLWVRSRDGGMEQGWGVVSQQHRCSLLSTAEANIESLSLKTDPREDLWILLSNQLLFLVSFSICPELGQPKPLGRGECSKRL